RLLTAAETLDIAGAWSGEPGRSTLLGLTFVTDPSSSDVAWLPAPLLGDDAVGAALAGHANVRGHNVKAIIRSLLERDIDLTGLRLDTAIAAYLIDPAEARYELADLTNKFTRFAPPSTAASVGQLDLDGTSVTDAERAGRDALAVHHIAEPIQASLAAQGMADLYHPTENPLRSEE